MDRNRLHDCGDEAVVNHPVRRRVVGLLMVLRGAGLVTAASTLMLSFVNVEDRGQGFLHFLLLVSGLFGLWVFARSEWAEIWMPRVISRALKRFTELDTATTLDCCTWQAITPSSSLKYGREAGWRIDS